MCILFFIFVEKFLRLEGLFGSGNMKRGWIKYGEDGEAATVPTKQFKE